ncbi:glycosyltransferase family 2 protein [Arcticibacter eurypsychrophilus]|uniref:glycosyltransferase family 2 protein n=1 Tax=Arcticibacter eurypsychrophilus TaxID=1434752 RepID=UPI00084CF7E6|nr:glycosyltransferase family A protein [Arcticibacter eurypsychrophilus]
MTTTLAIVIPAYKDTFFRRALESIAKQTSQDFVLYIGDDASPQDLYSIVQEFELVVKIKYFKFEKNLGGIDLVAHWNRCIAMSEDEEWIWMFSDDDIMESNCVEKFYSYINQSGSPEILHIDIKIIDKYDNLLHDCKRYPTRISAGELFQEKIKLRLSSTVVEYIFKRELFLREGGFENYDLAWGSDDATWIKFLRTNELITIEDCFVYWRYSSENISSKVNDSAIISRKVKANIKYLAWVSEFFTKNNIYDSTSSIDKLKWILQTVKSSSLSLKAKIELSFAVGKLANFGKVASIWGALYLAYSTRIFTKR